MLNVNKASIDGLYVDINKLQWFLLFSSAEFHPAILGDMDE